MRVVATAGHVDHGKSTLVRALTGTDPDRWAEEHARGLTIDLGYASLVLPGGEQLAFVDVPGHQFVERIHNAHQRLVQMLRLPAHGIEQRTVGGPLQSPGHGRATQWPAARLILIV